MMRRGEREQNWGWRGSQSGPGKSAQRAEKLSPLSRKWGAHRETQGSVPWDPQAVLRWGDGLLPPLLHPLLLLLFLLSFKVDPCWIHCTIMSLFLCCQEAFNRRLPVCSFGSVRGEARLSQGWGIQAFPSLVFQYGDKDPLPSYEPYGKKWSFTTLSL